MFFIFLLVLGTATALTETSSAAPAHSCVQYPNWEMAGGNIEEEPIYDLNSPTQCCDACANYKGKKKCAGYTFYWRPEGQNECWLKSSETFSARSLYASSGVMSKGKNERGSVSNQDPAGLLATKDALSSLMDISTYLPEVELQNSIVDKGRLLLTGSTNPLYKRVKEAFAKWTKQIPEECTTDGLDMSMMLVGQQISFMPFYGADCPEDCEDICENYRDLDGRYSCTGFNYVYSLRVPECYLMANSLTSILMPGTVSKASSHNGHEVGPVPTEPDERRQLYLEMLEKRSTCIET